MKTSSENDWIEERVAIILESNPELAESRAYELAETYYNEWLSQTMEGNISLDEKAGLVAEFFCGNVISKQLAG